MTSGFGIEYAEDTNKDYIETLIYKTKIKTLNYTNTGLSTDDEILLVLENGAMLYGDSGNDNIENFGFSNATIWGGHDNDTIHSYTIESADLQQNSIFGGPGNDKIAVYDKNSTVFGGSDDDSILVTGTKNQIFGDAGNDSIYLYTNANENTVSGGAGNDLIVLLEDTKNVLIKYTAGDGNDTIYGFDEDDAISISSAYKVSTLDSDIKISVGSGSMLLRGTAGKTIKINGKTINGGGSDDDTLSTATISPPNFPAMPSIVESPFIYGIAADDSISNSKARVLIFSGAGDDSISNWGSSVTIDGGASDDYIYNYYGTSVTIDGGTGNDDIDNYGTSVKIAGDAGNDTVYNYYGDSVKIDGGAGADLISLSSSRSYSKNNTISGGTDNDTIFLNSATTIGNTYVYNFGAGNDVIHYATRYDTISIGGGTYSTQASVSDLIIKVGSGAMTLVGAASTVVN